MKQCWVHIITCTDKWRRIIFSMQVLLGWGLLSTTPHCRVTLLSKLPSILTRLSSGSSLCSWSKDQKRRAQIIISTSQIWTSNIAFLQRPRSRQDESCCLWWHLFKQLSLISYRDISSPPSQSLKIQIPVSGVGALGFKECGDSV